MFLTENHLVIGAIEGAAVPDALLQRAAHARCEIGVTEPQLEHVPIGLKPGTAFSMGRTSLSQTHSPAGRVGGGRAAASFVREVTGPLFSRKAVAGRKSTAQGGR
jgi:hypothetical protein